MFGTDYQRTIDTLHQALVADVRVRALVLLGSLTYPDVAPDRWSDVDVLIVAADGVEADPLTWLACLGGAYAAEVSAEAPLATVRAFFPDGAHVDAVIAPEAAFTAGCPLPAPAYGFRMLFSRSGILDRALASLIAPAAATSPDPYDELANGFRFKGMLAASKIARGDLLVALHLTLGLLRDCAVLAMLLRDRELGTGHHRAGDPDDPRLRALPAPPTAYEPNALLDCIAGAARAFDGLATEWRGVATEDCRALLEWVGTVRASL